MITPVEGELTVRVLRFTERGRYGAQLLDLPMVWSPEESELALIERVGRAIELGARARRFGTQLQLPW
jgi:hypothetical protein